MKFIKGCLIFIILMFSSFMVAWGSGYLTYNYLDNKYPTEKYEEGVSDNPDVMLTDTYRISLEMAMANLEMEEVVNVDPEKVSFEEWANKLNSAIKRFEEIDKQSQILEKTGEAVTQKAEKNSVSFWKAKDAYALDSQEIIATFDAAPAGKRIRTLAKHLGVDARRARTMLKVAQGEIVADSWNKAGDTFENLENGARAVKNASKVGLYVGGAIMSGGATSTVGTIIAEGGAIIGGADLVLEIGEDTANLAFGYNKQNKAAAIFGDLRKITEPGATLFGLASLDAGDAYGKFSAFMMGADQVNSAIQENKYLGITPDFEKLSLKLDGMTKDEIGPWLKKNGISEKPDDYRDIIKSKYAKINNGENISIELSDNLSKTIGVPDKDKQLVNKDDCSIVGEWKMKEWYSSDGKEKAETEGYKMIFTTNKETITIPRGDGTAYPYGNDLEYLEDGCTGSYKTATSDSGSVNTFKIDGDTLQIEMSYGEIWILEKIK